jgi:uracil-DNA glycosylase
MTPGRPMAEVPDTDSFPEIRASARSCTGCGLYRDATQTVFGAGPVPARMMMVGEQPGDQEDRAGEPFVGPAGRLLDKALVDAGIDRAEVYVTNAVKHFKFRRDERGGRRIHQKPSRTEVVACHPWLAAETRLVRPELLVLLGATAAQAVLGSSFRLTRHRGEVLSADDTPCLATNHPSAVLRAPDRDAAYQGLVDDLRVAAEAVG